MVTKFLYRSGDFFLPRCIIDKLDTDIFRTRYVYMNGWSVMHFLTGVILSWYTRFSLQKLIIVHTVFEIWQMIIFMTSRDLPGLSDTVTDTLVYVFGIITASKIKKLV